MCKTLLCYKAVVIYIANFGFQVGFLVCIRIREIGRNIVYMIIYVSSILLPFVIDCCNTTLNQLPPTSVFVNRHHNVDTF